MLKDFVLVSVMRRDSAANKQNELVFQVVGANPDDCAAKFNDWIALHNVVSGNAFPLLGELHEVRAWCRESLSETCASIMGFGKFAGYARVM